MKRNRIIDRKTSKNRKVEIKNTDSSLSYSVAFQKVAADAKLIRKRKAKEINFILFASKIDSIVI